MPRFKLTIEYEGTRYSGWQIQKGQTTIQGKFYEVCTDIFKKEKFELYGSGRTDSGVHALGQVAHLDVKTTVKPEVIRLMLNDRLPADINVLSIERADNSFHARYDAVSRSYVYHISRRRTAFGKKLVWWIKDPLNAEKMKQVARIYEGFKDYRSFGQKEGEEKSTLVEVQAVTVTEDRDSIFIHIRGSHFLWKMVRRMVGVMAEVGRGNMEISDVHALFEEKSDLPARFTAPPSGLCLERVYYKGEKVSEGFNRCLMV